VKAAGWFAVNVVGVLCLTSAACSGGHSQPQEDISGRLETVAAAEGPPSYFLGESFEGIDLTSVEEEGAVFVYGTCEFEGGDGGCAPPMQVQNNVAHVSGAARGCSRLPDIRGVPAVSWGGGIVVFTQRSTVTVFDDGTDDSGELMRRMAEGLRPVSGSADVTKPLPAPAKDILDMIDKMCGAAPGDNGPPIEN
jgi:hypothetical protein